MTHPNKYHAVRTSYNGQKYDSKAEARYAAQLELLKHAIQPAHRVVLIERQPKFALPGGLKYIADFRVTYADDHVEVVDVKGIETRIFKMKLALMRESHPHISIRLVK